MRFDENIHRTVGLYSDVRRQVQSTPDVPDQAPPEAKLHGTVKLYDQQGQEAVQQAANPMAPAAQGDMGTLHGTVKLYDQGKGGTASAPAVPAVAPRSAAQQDLGVLHGTVKLYDDPAAMKANTFDKEPAGRSTRRADRLRPVEYPDQVQHFSPDDVDQTISEMHIDWNGRTYNYTYPVEISIGRGDGNSLVVQDAHVSGTHAVLNCSHSSVLVRNVSPWRDGRQNPLYINDVPVEKPTPLHTGDILKLNCVPMTITWKTETRKRPVTPEPVRAVPDMQSAHATIPPQREREMHATVKTIPLQVTWTIPGQQEKSAIAMLMPGRSVVIGRSENDDVFIDDPNYSLSRSHITIEMTDSGLMLSNSSKDAQGRMGYNPLYLDGAKVLEGVPLSECAGKVLLAGLVKIAVSLLD